MVITPSNRAPQAYPGNSIGFARFGSNVRVPVPADPALLNQVGQLTNGSFGWDFQNQRLVAGSNGSTIPVRLLVNYDQTEGTLNWLRSDNPKTSSILVLIQL